jgi:hypothetical protein
LDRPFGTDEHPADDICARRGGRTFAHLPSMTGTGSGQGRILTQRIYWLALSCFCLALAHLGYRRKSAKGFRINGRLGSTGWALVVSVVSLVLAVATGSMIK